MENNEQDDMAAESSAWDRMTYDEQRVVLRRYYRNRWLRRVLCLSGFILGLVLGAFLTIPLGAVLGLGAGIVSPGLGVAGAVVAWRLTKGLESVSYKP